MGSESIVGKATLCQSTLGSLPVAFKDRGCGVSDRLNLRDVEQLAERFDQWAGNLGALQPSTSSLSLEHRLRNNPVVRDGVVKLLDDLLESLRLASDIATGRRGNRTAESFGIDSDADLAEYDVSSSDSDSGSATSSTSPDIYGISEIDELMSAIRLSIDNLFMASIFIRKHAPKDKRQRASATKPFDNRADVVYIKDRYPLVAVKDEAFAARLGEANTRRRQYFKYCRDHNDRLSMLVPGRGWRSEARTGPQAAPRLTSPGVNPTKSILSGQTKPSPLADTEATEFAAGLLEGMQLSEHLDVPPARSVVSFATTVAEVSDDSLAFPPLPSEAENNSTFLCLYCFSAITLKGKNKEKHVLHDLEPYVCTFPGCGIETYQSQRAWFEHELLVHRSRWRCPKCAEFFESPKTLEQHVAARHSQEIAGKQTTAIIDLSRRPPEFIQPGECPFCDGAWASAEPNALPEDGDAIVVVDIDQLRRHVGHHLQQIALFSLPRLNREQEVGSNDAGIVPDRDVMPVAYKWIRDDCDSRGWRIVAGKRTTFSALAWFMARYRLLLEHMTWVPNNGSLFDVSLDDVPAPFKKVEDKWSVIYERLPSADLRIEPLLTIDHNNLVFDARLDFAGKFIASACRGSIHVFDAKTGARHLELKLPHNRLIDYCSVWFHPDGKHLVSGDSQNMAIIWNVEIGAVVNIFQGHSKSVWSVCWASDGQTIASGSRDATVRLWDAATGMCRLVIDAGSELNSVAISRPQPTVDGITHEGIVAGACQDGCLRLWDISTGSLVKWFDGRNYSPGSHCVAFSCNEIWNDTLLVVALDTDVKTWWLGRDLKRIHVGHKGTITAATFLPGTPFFVAGSIDGCIAIWDYNRSGKPSALLRFNRSHDIRAVAEAPGRNMFAIATLDGVVQLWSLHHRSTGV